MAHYYNYWGLFFAYHMKFMNNALYMMYRAELGNLTKKTQPSFPSESKWRGSIMDATGVRMDSTNYKGLRDTIIPRVAAYICQYLHCMAWMANAITRFTERAAPLHELLETA